MAENVKITINDERARRLIAGLGALADGSATGGPFGDLLTQWGREISAYERRRFDRFSKGGGNWKPLALSTVRRRAAAGKPSKTNPFAAFGGKKDGTGARSSLARDTKRGGKLVSAGRTVSVLRDTGTLMGALDIGKPGNAYRRIRGGVEFGIEGGPAAPKPFNFQKITKTKAGKSKRGKKARDHKSGNVTIGQVAAFHQSGGKHLPQRKVVDVPDQATLNRMSSLAAIAVERSMGGGS